MNKRNLRHRIRRNALCVALGMCLAGAAWADSGGLRVAISDASGQPLAGATVTASSPDSLVTKSGVTDASGRVRLQGLDPATNYTVEVSAPGHSAFRATSVAVVSGQDLSVGYTLGAVDATTLDGIVVTGASLAAIDTTSPTVNTVLNLDIVESLPTGRSYQSYLQLVPGVKPSQGGNPSSKSGVNYSDIGGSTGTSTDNIYFLDGVDVTDNQTGTFGANFNSEIIQEQQVITGGVPAEYAGGSGLVSKVVTKSGSDEWHGSVNYYLQNDSLVEDDEHGESAGFSTYDTAVTLGGPIVKEKLWFFGSYQKKNREDDVVNPLTGDKLRTVTTDQDLAFFKATWQITDNDRLVATFFNDPYERDGSTTATTLNNRDVKREQGGDNYKLDYTRDWGNLRINAYGYRHEGEVSDIAVNPDARNDVAYLGGSPTNADLQQGGLGSQTETWRNRDEFGISGEYYLDTKFGSHTFKAGYVKTDNDYKEDVRYTGVDQALYRSIAGANSGVTFEEYVSGGWTGLRTISGVDRPRIINAINGSPDQAYFVGLLDSDGDGAVSEDEINAYQFTATDGNPTGQVNGYRIQQEAPSPYTVTTEGEAFYFEDTWTLNQWTVNAGLRTERWSHYDSFDSKIFTFDWEVAPRLSVVYDLFGDGRSKVWGFAGRYYDPIRTNMTDFAGAGAGPTYNEQVFLGDRWLTFRSRGPGDAVFAPTTKTPYTDEFLIGYATTFGQDLSLSVIATKRVTKDILEDYDLGLYSNPDGDTSAGQANADSLFYLPYSYFGYAEAPPFNYVIGTLKGGEREYMGYEVTLQKQKSNNWQGMLSYTYNDAEGNTNSDSNADYQGDWLALDPRAPNAWGRQPGNIEHQFKAFGSYFWDNGFEVSGVFNWNSGIRYSRTWATAGRHLPDMDFVGYEYGGVYDTWILPGAIGSEVGPDYYTLDLRAKYTKALPVGELEFFLDVFNVLNKQSAIAEQDLVDGDGVYSFGEAVDWVEPRRAYLGVRYSF